MVSLEAKARARYLTLSGQYTYELECLRLDLDGKMIGHRHGANGPDIDGAGAGAGRLCPKCQRGRAADPAKKVNHE